MKKISIIIAAVCFLIFTASVFAEDKEQTYMLKQFENNKMIYHQYFSKKEWCYEAGHNWAVKGEKRTYSCEKIK